jgi:putative PIN family toxin of toxin-antitoxin system
MWYYSCYHSVMGSVVLDTSVVVSALRSQRGASLEIVAALGRGEFDVSVSVALLLEYEATLLRHADDLNIDAEDALALVDYICDVATAHEIFFLWRPFLRDAGDDLVLEIAVAAGSDAIVTHNVRDFRGAETLGIRVLTPRQFLHELRGR